MRKVTFYFIKMVLLVEFLVTAVHSFITSNELCLYTSVDASCTGASTGDCIDLCLDAENGDDNCEGQTCDSYMTYYQHLYNSEITAWDSCYVGNFEGGYTLDAIGHCVDDGLTHCEGEDVCIYICPFPSTSATCDGPCNEHMGFSIPQYDCGDYRSYLRDAEDTAGFTDFGECFRSDDEVDVYVTGCPGASSTNSSTNIGLIVGLVVGAVVLLVVIGALVNYIKSREKASKMKQTIEGA